MMKLDNYLKISAVSHPTTPAPSSQTSTAAAKKTPPSSTPFAKLPTSATIQKKKTSVQTPRTSQTTTAAKTTPLAQSTACAKSAATNVQKKRKSESEGKITIWYLGEIESCNK